MSFVLDFYGVCADFHPSTKRGATTQPQLTSCWVAPSVDRERQILPLGKSKAQGTHGRHIDKRQFHSAFSASGIRGHTGIYNHPTPQVLPAVFGRSFRSPLHEPNCPTALASRNAHQFTHAWGVHMTSSSSDIRLETASRLENTQLATGKYQARILIQQKDVNCSRWRVV